MFELVLGNILWKTDDKRVRLLELAYLIAHLCARVPAIFNNELTQFTELAEEETYEDDDKVIVYRLMTCHFTIDRIYNQLLEALSGSKTDAIDLRGFKLFLNGDTSNAKDGYELNLKLKNILRSNVVIPECVVELDDELRVPFAKAIYSYMFDRRFDSFGERRYLPGSRMPKFHAFLECWQEYLKDINNPPNWYIIYDERDYILRADSDAAKRLESNPEVKRWSNNDIRNNIERFQVEQGIGIAARAASYSTEEALIFNPLISIIRMYAYSHPDKYSCNSSVTNEMISTLTKMFGENKSAEVVEQAPTDKSQTADSQTHRKNGMMPIFRKPSSPFSGFFKSKSSSNLDGASSPNSTASTSPVRRTNSGLSFSPPQVGKFYTKSKNNTSLPKVSDIKPNPKPT